MNLKQELIKIFWSDNFDHCAKFRDASLDINRVSDTKFEIKVSQMYEFIGISFEKMLQLSELFGTKKIDVDDYSQSGCESCDYGSCYEHTIQIYDPTLNVENLISLCE